MAVMVKCSQCHKKISVKNAECKCGNNMKRDRKKLYYVVYTVNGKKVWEPAGHSLKLARELEVKKRHEATNKRIGIVNKELKNVSFSDFIENQFIPHYQMKNKGYEKEKSRFSVVKKYFGDIQIKNIVEYDIDKFLKHLQQERKISKSTINRYIATIKRMMNYAIELDIIAINPVRHHKQMQVDNIRHRYLTTEEIEKLLEAAKESKNAKLYYVIQIALKTGMRLSEILSLHGADINMNEKFIMIDQMNTKSKKQRFIPINDALFECLTEFYNKFDLDDNEELFEFKVVRNAYLKALERAEIKDFLFHDLRHTFASRLVQNSVELYTVSELLGHSDMSVTKRYAHLSKSHLREAVEKV